MMDPFFSIIIPTHNRLAFLKKAIASVLGQTFNSWELVIVNDASSDNTKFYLESLNNEKIKIINNTENLKNSGSRNNGINEATGEYICFLDDDDFFLPSHLENIYMGIKNSDFAEALFYTDLLFLDSKTGLIHEKKLDPILNLHPVQYLFHHKNAVGTPRAVISNKILKKERFNENITIGEDTELFLRIAAKFPLIKIDTATFVAVRHNDNSGSLKNNTGKSRLKGYKYIFSNPEVSKFIPRKLKNEMIAYCYLRMCEHYEYVSDHKGVLKSALFSLFYSLRDGQFKTKVVFILYHLPGGNLIKNLVRRMKY